jgi:hypothetical protein
MDLKEDSKIQEDKVLEYLTLQDNSIQEDRRHSQLRLLLQVKF